MKNASHLSRREFLKSFSTGGAGLLIGIYLSACGDSLPEIDTPFPTATTALDPSATLSPTETPRLTPNPAASFEPGIFLRVNGTGLVAVFIPRTELGQGSLTSLAMVVGEQLDVPLAQIRVEHSPLDRAYGELRTGGSDSISALFSRLSKAAAVARAMLITAAARLWQVPYESCRTADGFVFHDESGEQFSYAELVETAETIPVSNVASHAQTKNPEDYHTIGQPIGHLDNQATVTGATIYGLDVNLPGMMYATLHRCPVVRGGVASFDGSQALAVPGVQQVFAIQGGVAVVADSTWAALEGQRALQVEWQESPFANLSTASIREQFLEKFDLASSGDPDRLEAVYEVPFFAHAPPEPMNCLADVRPSSCQIWAPTQNPARALSVASAITNLPRDDIQIFVPRVGGGFGRRLQVDYVAQAVEISQRAGLPVKLVWTREEDIQQGYFHPFSLHYVSADLANPRMPRSNSQTYQSWDDLTFAWRSVTNFTDAFVQECFIDEMAAALNRDPYELRLELEPSSMHQVLELVAARAGWGEPLPNGWGRGIACWSTWNVTPVAQVAEVSVSMDGNVRVERVVCAIDCGLVINPDMVIAQMEGGIVWGLNAALKGSIEFENGRVLQGNFDDYPILRMDEMPLIEVHLIQSRDPPSGVGEMGIPPAAPAVFNAIYDAIGVRLRRMPFIAEDLQAS
jgi:CO/xanthine dehydrogenase Mo-binding subunit